MHLRDLRRETNALTARAWQLNLKWYVFIAMRHEAFMLKHVHLHTRCLLTLFKVAWRMFRNDFQCMLSRQELAQKLQQ